MHQLVGRFGSMLFCLFVLVAQNPNGAFAAAEREVQGKQGRTLVEGGIHPCSGLPPPMVHGLPRYSAGTVIVLQGKLTWGKWQHGLRALIFPSHVVARETVRVNMMYHFALLPGDYVLSARLPHSNVRPFAPIVVKEGITVHADIPNMCM